MELKKSKRKITRIILHCTATPEGGDMTVEEIRRIHVQEKKWKDIGYHYVIYRDGSVHEGRDVDKAGSHTKGYNSNSIGVVYVGGMTADNRHPKDTRTKEQRAALKALVKELKRLYPLASIHGHNEFAAKACPSFNVKKEFMLFLLIVMMVISCSTKRALPAPEVVKAVETRIESRVDTICLRDSIVRESSTVIREADSLTLASFGLKLDREIKAFLIEQKNIISHCSAGEKVVYKETIIHDSVPFIQYIERAEGSESKRGTVWNALRNVIFQIIAGSIIIIIVIILIKYKIKKNFFS